jgi:CubicO group peptidase (beta-lactamase class C family)
MPFWKYVQESVLKPLNMTSTFVCCFDDQKYPSLDNVAPSGVYNTEGDEMLAGEDVFFNYYPAGSIWSTAPDMLKFAQMLLLKGAIPGAGGARVLLASSVDAMMGNYWGEPIGTGFGLVCVVVLSNCTE